MPSPLRAADSPVVERATAPRAPSANRPSSSATRADPLPRRLSRSLVSTVGSRWPGSNPRPLSSTTTARSTGPAPPPSMSSGRCKRHQALLDQLVPAAENGTGAERLELLAGLLARCVPGDETRDGVGQRRLIFGQSDCHLLGRPQPATEARQHRRFAGACATAPKRSASLSFSTRAAFWYRNLGQTWSRNCTCGMSPKMRSSVTPIGK